MIGYTILQMIGCALQIAGIALYGCGYYEHNDVPKMTGICLTTLGLGMIIALTLLDIG